MVELDVEKLEGLLSASRGLKLALASSRFGGRLRTQSFVSVGVWGSCLAFVDHPLT